MIQHLNANGMNRNQMSIPEKCPHDAPGMLGERARNPKSETGSKGGQLVQKRGDTYVKTLQKDYPEFYHIHPSKRFQYLQDVRDAFKETGIKKLRAKISEWYWMHKLGCVEIPGPIGAALGVSA